MKPSLAFPIPHTPEFDVNRIKNISEKYLDISYASEKEHVLDLYLPEKKKEEYPLIIYIHEGAFIFGSKRDKRMESLFTALQEGYAIASVDYRKADQVTWPAPIYDIKAAIRFLRAHAGEYKLDKKRFTVWGMSAGAYLGVMTAVTNHMQWFEDCSMGNPHESSEIQSVVDLCGACAGFHRLDDFIEENGFGIANHNEANSPESILMGQPLKEARELCNMANPINYIREDIPPFFVLHCLKDPVVPVQQSRLLVEEIVKKAGADKVTAIFTESEADHGKPDYDTRSIVDAALEFLNRY